MFYQQGALGWDCGGKGCKQIRVDKADKQRQGYFLKCGFVVNFNMRILGKLKTFNFTMFAISGIIFLLDCKDTI